MLPIGWVLAFCPLMVVQAQEKGKEQSELEKLAKDLRHKDVKVRLKAVKSLAEKGEDAAPVAGPLCDALMDRSPQVAVAALEALEKVRPDLYKHVSTLVLDKDPKKQLKAIRELGLMGEKANPVFNLLLARLRTVLATRFNFNVGLSDVERAYFTAIRQIKPDDVETIKLFKVMAGVTNRDSYARLEAIRFLNDWAGDDAARRKELLPLLKAGLDDPVCQEECIKISGSYGSLAKDFAPLLRKLKLSSVETIRNAASEALDKIDNP
jgi:HEAT repeat protein